MEKEEVNFGSFQIDSSGNTIGETPFFGESTVNMLVPQIDIEKITESSLRDLLTQIYNRKGFDEKSEAPMQKSIEEKTKTSLLFIDADHFKSVNDNYGHTVGDIVLKRIAKIIQSHVRETDILARFGGEEFVVLLPKASPEDAERIANNIRDAIENTVIATEDRRTFSITVSIGIHSISPKEITIVPEKNESLLQRYKRELIGYSDKALYSAKHAGRNCVALYNESMSQESK